MMGPVDSPSAPAADVDHVQPGVVAPAEGNDVRHPGSVDGREPAELAFGQVGQLGIREHAHLALTTDSGCRRQAPGY